MSELLTPQSPFAHRLAVAWQLFWAALRKDRFVRAEVLTAEEAEELDDIAAYHEAIKEYAPGDGVEAAAFFAQLEQLHLHEKQ